MLYTVTIKGIPVEKLDCVEIHVTPFVINQKFDGEKFVYNDKTDVSKLFADWNYGKGAADIGTLGVEQVTVIKMGDLLVK